MAADPITAALNVGEILIERIWPDPAEQGKHKERLAEIAQTGDLAALKAEVDIMQGQLAINLKEAEHPSLFVSGWRPAIGWICAIILAFNYIGVYLFEYILAVFSIFAEEDTKMIPAPERLDMSELWPVLVGMLGIGGMRSYDKLKGKDTKKIG